VQLFLRITLLLTVAALAVAEERWIRIQSGPFEVLSPAGERPARHIMADAEQLRHAVGELLGLNDLTTIWPVRIVVIKNPRTAVPGAIAMGRDSWISMVDAAGSLTPEWRKACVRILLEDNTGPLPPGMDNGLITLFSTLESNGPKLTLGTPPPAPERTRDWARLHLFATQPEYAGRLRVLLSNMAHGGDYDAACRNAFEKPASEMENRVDVYFKAGQYSAVAFSGRALAERDFVVREATAYDGNVAMADVLLADPARTAQTEAAYKALTGPEAVEGLAMLAGRRKDPGAAKLYQSSTASGSKSARAWLGTGTKEGAIKAIELNPKWPDPHVRLAELSTAPNVKAAEMGKAAKLAPRNAQLWKAAAIAYAAANQFAEAGKAWTGAERAALDEKEREQIRQTRRENEVARADFEASERRRIANEEVRELDRLRNAAMDEVRAAESKARKEMAAGGAVPAHPEQWWDGPAGPVEKASGTLQRVDCLAGGRAKITIQTGPKTTVVLAVRDPGKIMLTGGGVQALGCGPQRPPRAVAVEYKPAKDARLGTAGDVQVVEFR
jgi:hypothetical protein